VFADCQCCVKQDDREVRISIEDLAWAVIDTPQATLASALMAACMEASVAIVLATRHTVGTSPSIPQPSSTERNRALAGRREGIRSRSGSGKKWFVARILNQSAVLVADWQ
jgi:CRISP-associated protein Cas1